MVMIGMIIVNSWVEFNCVPGTALSFLNLTTLIVMVILRTRQVCYFDLFYRGGN